MEEYRLNLAKKGDELVVRSSNLYYGDSYYRAKVVKVTDKTVTLNYKDKNEVFYKSTGRLRGYNNSGDYDRWFFYIPSLEMEAMLLSQKLSIKVEKLLKMTVEKLDNGKFSTQELQEVYNYLRKLNCK